MDSSFKINSFGIIESSLKENKIANLNTLGRIRNDRNIDVYVDNVCNPTHSFGSRR